MCRLFIDTSSNQEIAVGLKVDERKYWLKRKIGRDRAQVVLPMIDMLLKKHRLTINDLGSINVHTGPGSFTGLRVGIAVANSLAFLLGILVNGKKQVSPLYGPAPH